MTFNGYTMGHILVRVIMQSQTVFEFVMLSEGNHACLQYAEYSYKKVTAVLVGGICKSMRMLSSLSSGRLLLEIKLMQSN